MQITGKRRYQVASSLAAAVLVAGASVAAARAAQGGVPSYFAPEAGPQAGDWIAVPPAPGAPAAAARPVSPQPAAAPPAPRPDLAIRALPTLPAAEPPRTAAIRPPVALLPPPAPVEKPADQAAAAEPRIETARAALLPPVALPEPTPKPASAEPASLASVAPAAGLVAPLPLPARNLDTDDGSLRRYGARSLLDLLIVLGYPVAVAVSTFVFVYCSLSLCRSLRDRRPRSPRR
jgi:hypothetical protein